MQVSGARVSNDRAAPRLYASGSSSLTRARCSPCPQRHPGLRWLCVATLALGCASPSLAFADGPPVARLGDGAGALRLLPHGEILQDPSQKLTPEQVVQLPGEAFTRSRGGELGLSNEVFWFRARVSSEGQARGRILAFAGLGAFRNLRVFMVEGGETIGRWEVDPEQPFARREMQTPEAAFRVELPADREVTLVARVQGYGGGLVIDPSLWGYQAYLEGLQRSQAVILGYYAMVGILALYHLVIFFAVRDRSYLYYAAFFLMTVLMDAAHTGVAAQTFYASSPGLSFTTWFVSAFLMCWAMVQFARSALDGAQQAPSFDRGLAGLAWVMAGLALLSPVLPVKALTAGFMIVSGPGMLACLALAVICARRGHVPARLYLWSYVPQVAGVAVALLVGLGLLHVSDDHVVANLLPTRLGGVAQALLFALVLARRYSLLHAQLEAEQAGRIQAQSEALAVKEEAAATLQQKVDARTVELEAEKEQSEQQRLAAERAREQAERARVQAEQAKRALETEHRLAVEAREEADRARQRVEVLDRQKTDFFQTISHELRTPLTLVLNPLEKLTLEQVGNRDLQLAERNARRLLRLVNQLLDFQKLSAGKLDLHLHPIDLVRFVWACSDYVERACEAKDQGFAVTLDGRALTAADLGYRQRFVLAEVDALEKVVFNYLSNALKHTPSGGKIQLDLVTDGDGVRMVVSDTGPGIARDDRDMLFQLFSQVDSTTTRAHEGTGLGLALAKELTSGMKGTVGVDSTPGVGSRFWSRFALVEAPAADATEGQRARNLEDFHVKPWMLAGSAPRSVYSDADQPYVNGGGDRVLVVDDLPDMREMIRVSLGAVGYQVRTACDAFEAMEGAREAPPDLIVTDWMMPGKSGLDLILEIRGTPALATVPVVLLTARADEEGRLLGTEVGADAFLGKPFNEQELCATVRNLLALKQREREVTSLNQELQEVVLKRYLPGPLVDAIVSGERALDFAPTSESLTVLFANLEDFTGNTDSLLASQMAELLNEYLVTMTDLVFEHGGTVDKFIGDSVMAVFGAPEAMPGAEQARRAAACALAMQQALVALNEGWASQGLPALALRVGVHHGPCVVGNFGGEHRMEYTAIGSTVNIASRIEEVCPPGSVLISKEVGDLVSDTEVEVEALGHQALRGVAHPVRLFRLVSAKADGKAVA